MNKYVFVLGRQWRLSVAEIISIFGEKNCTYNNEVLIKEMDEDFDPVYWQDKLGGTIKIAKVLDGTNDLGELVKIICGYLLELPNQKIKFALSIYSFAQTFKKDLKNLLKNIKNKLRKEGRGVRFYNKPEENIRSVVIFEERLHEKGSDMIVVKEKGKYLIGGTVAVQHFKKYSLRDYDRPARDTKSGMLPPKLAQIMINLCCGNVREGMIYDPFCGSGTVLMEGMLMGYKVLGTDISEKAISDTQKNIEWLSKEFKVDLGRLKDVFVQDATKLDHINMQPDFVVAEGYLGPPLSKLPSHDEINKNFRDIEDVLIGALKSFNNVFDKGMILVLAVPFYRIKGKMQFLQKFYQNFKKLGYSVENWPNLSLDRGSLLYFRRDQIVGREIFKLKLVEKKD